MLRNIVRGIVAAWWALRHADDLTMLRFELERAPFAPTGHTVLDQCRRADAYTRQYLAQRFLGSLPLH